MYIIEKNIGNKCKILKKINVVNLITDFSPTWHQIRPDIIMDKLKLNIL